MGKHLQSLLCAGVLSCVIAVPEAQAFNLRFLAETPIAYLKPKDKTSITAAVNELLNSKKDDEAQNWTNEGLGNITRVQAELTATDTTTVDDKTCRKLHVALHAKGQDQTLSMQVCKVGSGSWVLQKK